MVEVDAQVLGGTAITVFLALMFFGVVVLWDVALALRSVGDKIDKLEDNVDDDLMDIAYSLDNISNAPGGGGTQLHLNSGSISSGPATGQAQGESDRRTQGAQSRAADVGPQPSQRQQQPQQSPQEPAQGAASTDATETPDSSSDAPNGEVPPDSDGGADSAVGAAAADEDVEDIAEAGETTADEPESAPNEDGLGDETELSHPRATVSRGRFITSPDRTAWYATPLDREAIRTAGPPIAGELTDGSDSSIDENEIIAAGPVESEESVETTGAGESADGEAGETDETAEAETEAETASTGAETPPTTAGEDDDADSVTDDTETGESGPDTDENESGEDSSSAGVDTDVLAFDEGDADADSRAPAAADARADENGDESDEQLETAETELEPVDETDGAVPDTESDGRSDALERPDAGTDATESAETDDSDPPVESETEIDQQLAGDSNPFEFDDGDLEDDVTVEEAVDTINENAPAPELSSHQFDVTAEVHATEEDGDDGDGAVLIFEFETDTVDISGSTKRLLQYQMRSFADRDSTPDGDVTIGQQRIVIEIPTADGNAVQHWGEAAVSIIDRTLYLSDNSSDDS